MAKLEILAGTTSKMVSVFLQDSSSTTGAGLTGLVFNTASLTAYYYREGAGSATAISLATMTLGTWATSGFVVVDGTNMPGMYSLGLPNAAIAAGAKSVTVYIKGATNLMPCVLEIELTATDNQDSAAYGLSRIDAAVTSRLAPTVAARTLDVSAGGEAGVDWANVGSPTTVVGLSGTTVLASTTATNVTTVSTGAITSGSFAAGAIDAAAIAANAIGSSEFAQTARDAVADALIARNVAGGSSTGRTVKYALSTLVNKVDIAAGTMTCYDTDDTTPLFTAAVTTTAGNPISQIDPA